MAQAATTQLSPGLMFGRGMSFPPRITPDGRIAWSEGAQNVREAIRVILMTEQRERLYLPDFGGGLRPFLFEPNTVTTRFQISERIRKALQKWEPRINVANVDVEPDPSDPQAAIATIQYKLVATDAAERLSVSVALAS
jgi:phage baseplate assembly protein W